MRHPAVERLLILQDRDTKRLALETQLKATPKEMAAVEQKIAGEKAAIEAARTEVRTLESSKKMLETEIGTADTTLAKYKTQQASVRKNEEFQALGHQIETTQAAIDALEEKEIGIMLQIDEAKQRFADAEKVLKQNISGHEERIHNLREREKHLAEELKGAQADFEAARRPLDEPTLRIYDRSAARHQPAVVAIRGAKCGGCHLKVSGEVETDARRGEKLAICDQCGRIVWWES